MKMVVYGVHGHGVDWLGVEVYVCHVYARDWHGDVGHWDGDQLTGNHLYGGHVVTVRSDDWDLGLVRGVHLDRHQPPHDVLKDILLHFRLRSSLSGLNHCELDEGFAACLESFQ